MKPPKQSSLTIPPAVLPSGMTFLSNTSVKHATSATHVYLFFSQCVYPGCNGYDQSLHIFLLIQIFICYMARLLCMSRIWPFWMPLEYQFSVQWIAMLFISLLTRLIQYTALSMLRGSCWLQPRLSCLWGYQSIYNSDNEFLFIQRGNHGRNVPNLIMDSY